MIKKKTIRRTKRELTPKQNKTHTYIKKKKRERMVSKITFFLESKTCNEEMQNTIGTKKRDGMSLRKRCGENERETRARTLVVANNS